MDLATLAQLITSMFVPYVAKAGAKLAEKVGERLPDQIQKLWEIIYVRFKGKSATEEVINDFAANPGEEDAQAIFRIQLKKLLSEDIAFAEELRTLLPRVNTADVSNIGSGAVATDGSVASGMGGIAIGGNVTGNARITLDRQDIHGNPQDTTDATEPHSGEEERNNLGS
jgi:hypothetical protein